NGVPAPSRAAQPPRSSRSRRTSTSRPHSSDTLVGSTDGERSRWRGYRSRSFADAGHAHGLRRRSPTVTIARVAEKRGSRHRELRGPLLPPTVPGWRSRAERFDMAVLEAYEPIEQRWQERVSALDVAVDEIPRISPNDPDSVQWPPEVVADGPIALARLIPAGVDVRGNATRARIVLFRKPIERRAKDTDELAELLHELLWLRWPRIWASNRPSSTRRSTTTTNKSG